VFAKFKIKKRESTKYQSINVWEERDLDIAGGSLKYEAVDSTEQQLDHWNIAVKSGDNIEIFMTC
jgi:hypothetical protein